MQAYEIRAKVENGHLPPKVRQEIGEALGKLNGAIAHIKIEKSTKKRTVRQNDYYKGFMLPMITAHFNSYGNTLSTVQADQIIKKAVNYMRPVHDGSGEVIDMVPRSTTEMDTIGMSEFYESVIAYAAQNWNLEIPLPQEEIP